jgi:hypothetical protein
MPPRLRRNGRKLVAARNSRCGGKCDQRTRALPASARARVARATAGRRSCNRRPTAVPGAVAILASMILGLSQQKNPIFIARYCEFDIFYEGVGFSSARTSQMMGTERNTRYADICGDASGQFTAYVGWRFRSPPLRFVATDRDGTPAAIGWCAPIRTPEQGIGCNLTYAVAARHEGRGLGKLVSAMAFLALYQGRNAGEFVNVQCRADNSASAGVAASFGFAPYLPGYFTMPLGDRCVSYVGFRLDAERFRVAAEQTIASRGLDDLLLLIRAEPSVEAETTAPSP